MNFRLYIIGISYSALPLNIPTPTRSVSTQLIVSPKNWSGAGVGVGMLRDAGDPLT